LTDGVAARRAVHNSGILHGDFKTLNLLVGADQHVKVADFGLSKVRGQGDPHLQGEPHPPTHTLCRPAQHVEVADLGLSKVPAASLALLWGSHCAAPWAGARGPSRTSGRAWGAEAEPGRGKKAATGEGQAEGERARAHASARARKRVRF
jgi:serine/threonine protein kinase